MKCVIWVFHVFIYAITNKGKLRKAQFTKVDILNLIAKTNTNDYMEGIIWKIKS